MYYSFKKETMIKQATAAPPSSAGSSKAGSQLTSDGTTASSGVVARRRRKANFSTEEVDILVREVSARRHVLFGTGITNNNGRSSDLGPSTGKSSEKLSAWRAVASCVNCANRGEPRTVREIRKKWENVTSTYRKRQLGEASMMEVEPHLLASSGGGGTRGPGGHYPIDEVLACARAYQANRMMQPERRLIPTVSRLQPSMFVECKEEYSSEDDGDDDAILGIQPDVHIESLETPLTFTDSDDVTSRHRTMEDSSDDAAGGGGGGYHGNNRQLMQLQQQLRSGEVVISPAAAIMQGEVMNGGGGGKRDSGTTVATRPSTSSSGMREESVEEQKLAVLKQLLKVETKRLKIEKKRFKLDKLRFKMMKASDHGV